MLSEPVTQASLRTDLAVAPEEIHRARAERDKLRARLRLQPGAEIEGPRKAEPIARQPATPATALPAASPPSPTSPTSPSNQNREPPGTFQDQLQITAAMRLLLAGVDITVIALWLGHFSGDPGLSPDVSF